MKYLYKYPQREFPTRISSRPTARVARRVRVRAARHRRLRRRPLLRRVRGVREGGPEDVLVRITVHNRGPEAARCACCRRCGSATPGRGASDAEAVAARAAPASIRRRTTTRRLLAVVRRRAGAALHREREQRQRLWGQPNPSPYVKDAFHATSSRAARRGESRADRHQGGGALRARRAAGGSQRRCACGSRPRRRRRVRDFDGSSTSRIADADEFYERITPRR
jgi:hypothetical protein